MALSGSPSGLKHLQHFAPCNFSSRVNSKTEKTTQVFLYSTSVLFAYTMNEKGHSLACQFEQMMESGDASHKEAPPSNPKRRELMRFQGISMLVVTKTEEGLKQGLVMAITKGFNVACSTIYRLQEHMECMCAMSLINSPKLSSWKKILGDCLFIQMSSFKSVSGKCC